MQTRSRDSLAVLDKELQVDFKNGLEQAHVGALVQSDLVFPDVDDEDLARGQGEKSTLALKVLVLASLSAVGTLDVHDENVLGHARAALLTLVLAHPDSLCGLATLLLRHDAKLGAEEVVEERRLARGLRAKDGNEVVVEASGDDFLNTEVRRQISAAWRVDISIEGAPKHRGSSDTTYLNILSSSMTWMPCS